MKILNINSSGARYFALLNATALFAFLLFFGAPAGAVPANGAAEVLKLYISDAPAPPRPEADEFRTLDPAADDSGSLEASLLKKRISGMRLHSVTIFIHNYGGPSAAGVRDMRHIFDPCGNLIELVDYDGDGKASSVKTFAYDEKGRLLRQTDISGDGIVESYAKYKYDAKGNRLEEAWFLGNGDPEKRFAYRYDASGRRTSFIEFNSEGAVEFENIRQYDGNGRLVRESRSERYDGGKSVSMIYKYDRNGRPFETLYYDEAGRTVRAVKRIYGSNGLPETVTDHNIGDGTIMKFVFKYSSDRMTEKIEYVNSTLSGKTIWKRDAEGRTVEEFHAGANGKTFHRLYFSYDGRGNVSGETKYDGDGTMVYKYSYRYDDMDNLAEKIKYKSLVLPESRFSYIYETAK